MLKLTLQNSWHSQFLRGTQCTPHHLESKSLGNKWYMTMKMHFL
jgi:hypothetical protein